MLDAFAPLRRPAQVLDQFTRQAEWKIEAADPFARLRQPLRKAFQRVYLFEFAEHDAGAGQGADGHHDGLAAGRAAGEVAADQERLGHRAYTRPQIAAVAIRSSSSASETLPETA